MAQETSQRIAKNTVQSVPKNTKETSPACDQKAASSSSTPDTTTLGYKINDILRLFVPLLPLVIGLAFGRAGLIVASYGSYTSTDEGVFTDGAMLVALSILSVFFLIIIARKITLSKKSTNRLMRVCIALEALSLIGLAAVEFSGNNDPRLRFALCSLCTLVASGAIFYWLRRARGSGTAVVTLFVFSALILSEIEIYLCTLLPIAAGNMVATALVFIQFPCMLWARSVTQPFNIASPRQVFDYFGFTKTLIQDKRFLAATAIGVACLSIVIGLLRGYPSGESIAFTPTTRVLYAVLTVCISAGVIALALMKKQRVLTVYIFIAMQLLACMALIAHAAFPDMLDIGAIFTTTLNALMVAFTWYIIIAFMSYGWRDPYYYAIAGWVIWLGSRAVARIIVLDLYEPASNDFLLGVFIGTLVLVSTQVTFIQFLNITSHTSEEAEAPSAQQSHKLVKLMGLDEHENLASMRQASMQHNAEELGKQFLLSEREIEVLSLYALGYTQKRVAEELFITPATAHAHIKRIYSKTGLHSRQEILDYLQQYTS